LLRLQPGKPGDECPHCPPGDFDFSVGLRLGLEVL